MGSVRKTSRCDSGRIVAERINGINTTEAANTARSHRSIESVLEADINILSVNGTWRHWGIEVGGLGGLRSLERRSVRSKRILEFQTLALESIVLGCSGVGHLGAFVSKFRCLRSNRISSSQLIDRSLNLRSDEFVLTWSLRTLGSKGTARARRSADLWRLVLETRSLRTARSAWSLWCLWVDKVEITLLGGSWSFRSSRSLRAVGILRSSNPALLGRSADRSWSMSSDVIKTKVDRWSEIITIGGSNSTNIDSVIFLTSSAVDSKTTEANRAWSASSKVELSETTRLLVKAKTTKAD